MKKFFKILFVFFLIVLFLVILAGAGYWALVIQGWPRWISAVIMASIAGIVLGFFAIKKFLIRRNEKKFVQNVIHEEEALMESASDQGKVGFKDMQTQWKESIEKLKKSHLRKFGNPLYVLPWYMILGESRAGKTSAIKNANLSSSLTDVSKATVISGTKNCDWWFLEQSVVLDTAGRYAIPIEEESDKKEWQMFLTLLSKYRKKEPINGVIVAVSSTDLLSEDGMVLSEKAKTIRQRIHQMMRVLGAKFPVYMLVTKMDLVNGFTDFCDHLEKEKIDQVMGFFNESGDKDCMAVLENCMTTIFNRIRELRSVFIHNRINNFAAVFSNEFIQLKAGLESYVQSLFGDDIYQETPLFRGIYFSSALREGKPQSTFLTSLGIEYTHEDTLDKHKGFFLKSLFHKILPKDRNVFTPLSEFLMWRRTTITLGVFSAMLICLALSGILSFSYFNNLKALDQLSPDVFKALPESKNMTDTILALDRQRFEINKLIGNNKNWLLPRLGLNHSRDLENSVKLKFVENVKQKFVDPTDQLFSEKLNGLHAGTPHDEIIDYIVYAARRILVLQKRVSNDSLPEKEAFGKSIANLFEKFGHSIPSAIALKYAGVYYDYLEWNRNKETPRVKLEKFQHHLSQLTGKTGDFQWLLSEYICSVPDISVADFIRGYTIDLGKANARFHIKGAFTAQGREEITQFIKMVGQVYSDKEAFANMEDNFWAWYTKQFYDAWHHFMSIFPEARDWMKLIDNQSDFATLMTTDQNPYFQLLEKMALEFKTLQVPDNEQPAWVQTVLRLDKIKYLAETEIKKEKGSLIAKLAITKEKITDRIEKKADVAYEIVDRKKAAELDYHLKLSKIWNDYIDSLKNLSAATAYNEKCFYMFADLFKALSDPSKQSEPFNKTHDHLLNINTILKQKSASPAVVNIIKGPFDYLTAYGMAQSVEYLQKKWEEVVLSTAHGVDSDNYYFLMFDKSSGAVWKFVNEHAAPFLDQSRVGFYAKKAFGMSLPFSSSFFNLLNKGEKLSLEHQDEYMVNVSTAPMDVNREAVIRPYSNSLALECADQKIELVNNNFLETQKFIWKPASCGDVILTVTFGDAVLQKKYPGKLGFAKFLDDFKDGSRLFTATDFPEHMGYLVNNKVTDITISYQITGIEPVLKFMNRRAPEITPVIFTNVQAKQNSYPKPDLKPEPAHPEDQLEKQAAKLYGLKDRYSVTMETVPMDVNIEAKVKPVSSVFWMRCNDETIRLENNNYLESLTFNWEPENCGKVMLIIHFPELTIFTEYADYFTFLKAFKYKSKTFSSNDFPKEREELLKRGISAITIAYSFSGDLPFEEDTVVDEPKVYKLKTKLPEEPQKQLEKASEPEKKPAVKTPMKQWIQEQNLKYFTIHVMLGPDKDKIIEFAEKNGLKDNCAVYRSLINGKERYNLIYGSYDSFSSAQKALAGLSQEASTHSPWIRTFSAVMLEIK